MANKVINTKKTLKICACVYAVIIVVGLVASLIGGVKLDISFSGGTTFTYSYTGNVAESDFKEIIDEELDKDFSISHNTSIADDSKSYTVTLAGKDSITSETQAKITDALENKFPKNDIKLYNSDSVDASLAGTFFAKCLVAVVITAALVIIYVGIRFKKIGGISAALTALCALVLDLVVSFAACVLFRLPIDMNYMAVVLTILGYSLNDTIVIYDRVRENKRLYPHISIGENMNKSVSDTLTRNIITTVTTVCAVLTIVVVSEVCGLTTLRSFAIPMTFGLISGCCSSLFVAGPLWVMYKERKSK